MYSDLEEGLAGVVEGEVTTQEQEYVVLEISYLGQEDDLADVVEDEATI